MDLDFRNDPLRKTSHIRKLKQSFLFRFHQIITEDGISSLRMRRILTEDAGEYSVQVFNQYGNVISSTKMEGKTEVGL